MNRRFFSGGDESQTHRAEARAVALRLVKTNPSLGYGVIFSAAAYLLRAGQPLRDAFVIQEARRRKVMVTRAVESRRRRFRKDAAA